MSKKWAVYGINPLNRGEIVALWMTDQGEIPQHAINLALQSDEISEVHKKWILGAINVTPEKFEKDIQGQFHDFLIYAEIPEENHEECWNAFREHWVEVINHIECG